MAKKIADIKVESHSKKHLDTPLPAYFLSLTVENVRCFGPKQTLDLSDGKGRPAQWTIILGDNGVGKTTLLQCLSMLLPVGYHTGNMDIKSVIARYWEYSRLQSDWRPYRYNTRNFELSGDFFTGARLINTMEERKVSHLSM